MKSDLRQYSRREGSTGPYADNLHLDVLIVGGGFGGVYCLYEMRKLGLNAVIYEAGTDLGGTWHWNRYPGAAVDSEIPHYQYSIPETYKNWTWSTNYPDFKELRAYFDHVDKVLHIKKDCAFSTVVVDAQFNVDQGRWQVKTEDGRTATAKYLIVAAGFSAKRYIPPWSGIESFKGIVHHSSFWPEEDIDVRGKRCAIIGTGASGVQITQAWGPIAGSLKVLQRTPNLAIQMKKRDLTPEEQNQTKAYYPELFRLRENCFAGFMYDFCERNLFEDSKEEQEAFLEKLWESGGFGFWVGNYKDYLFDAKANRVVYDFWARKARARIQDPRKKDLLAPLNPPHPFGVKRPCLESTYYEQFNRSNVDIIDVEHNPIEHFTETGIQLKDGTHLDLDVICIATGFDISTGGMTNMGLRSIHGTTLQDEWKSGLNTYLGTTVSGYPNMFHLYGPHAPTLLSNGPTSVEIQGRWISDAIKQMERKKIKYIDATEEATKAWKKKIMRLSDITLFPTTRSTYMGGNVAGKPVEPMNYTGGVDKYVGEIRAVLPGFDGFAVVEQATSRVVRL